MPKRKRHIYEEPSPCVGWHIAAEYDSAEELAKTVAGAKASGLQEGLDFRTRTDRTT